MNQSFSLLGAGDSAPYQVLNPNSQSPLVIVVDHAGREIPEKLGRLGLSDELLGRHIAWDIGAYDLACEIARRFNSTMISATYSRLVIDCNRYPHDPGAIIEISDGIVIEGNRNLDPFAAERRIQEIFRPYHNVVSQKINALLGRGVVPFLLSVHSMTPELGGNKREQDISICWAYDKRVAVPAIQYLNETTDAVIGDNQPYALELGIDYTVPEHAVARGLPSLMVEFRQDLLNSEKNVAFWAGQFSKSLAKLLELNLGIGSPIEHDLLRGVTDHVEHQ